MTENDKQHSCDILILVAVRSEFEQLEKAARAFNTEFVKKFHKILGTYYSMGKVGDYCVNAKYTREMGPLGYRGSASMAINFKMAMNASKIIQLGMCFGISTDKQKQGDLIISTYIVPYDRRKVFAIGTTAPVRATTDDDRDENKDTILPIAAQLSQSSPNQVPSQPVDYRVDYSDVKSYPCNQDLLKMFEDEKARGGYNHAVYLGGLLSGGAQIRSRKFVQELIESIQVSDDEEIKGGDMEGVGLLSVSPQDDPIWIVVKGISDFADENYDRDIQGRELACLNSANFVLNAISKCKAIRN